MTDFDCMLENQTQNKLWTHCRASTCWLTHMLPEMSTQNTTIDSSTPPQLVAVVTGAGFNMYVTSASFGISSGRISTTVLSSQNSHFQTCVHTANNVQCTPEWL